MNRALVEWLVGGLPDGGSADSRPELDEVDAVALTARFLGSPHGVLFGRHHRVLLGSMIDFGSVSGAGDPMRWTTSRARQWLFDDVLEDSDLWWLDSRATAPFLLRAYIRFAHAEVGIRPELTAEVVGAIERWESEFQRTLHRRLAEDDENFDVASGE